MWKEAVVILRYSPYSCMEGLRKTTKNLCQIQCSADIRTEYFLNAGQKRYRISHLAGSLLRRDVERA